MEIWLNTKKNNHYNLPIIKETVEEKPCDYNQLIQRQQLRKLNIFMIKFLEKLEMETPSI